MTDQAFELRRLVESIRSDTGGRCRGIAVTSGKGGVGKTSIAVNLALALAQAGSRVMLFDADWGLSNADILLGLTPSRDLRHVISGACAIEDILCPGPMGITLVPGASGIADIANMPGDQRDRLVREVSRAASEMDTMIVDTAPGISDAVVDLATGLGEALVVTTPEPASLTDAYSFVKVALQRRPDLRISLVINMAFDQGQAENVARGFSRVAERFLEHSIPMAGFVCMDAAVSKAARRQVPFLVDQPHSAAAGCIRRLGRDLFPDRPNNMGMHARAEAFCSF